MIVAYSRLFSPFERTAYSKAVLKNEILHSHFLRGRFEMALSQKVYYGELHFYRRHFLRLDRLKKCLNKNANFDLNGLKMEMNRYSLDVST